MEQAVERSWWWAGIAVLLLFVVYAPALSAGFIWDDPEVIAENPLLRSAAGLRRIWFEIGAMLQYYPMVHSSFWLEYQVWGLDPLAYHFDNIFLHALNALLVWRLALAISLPAPCL